MKLIKQHLVLSAIAAILVLLTLIIWVAQDNEQVLLVQPQETASVADQAHQEAQLVYEAEMLADYTLPDRYLAYTETAVKQTEASTTASSTAVTSTAEPVQTEATQPDQPDTKLAELRPPRTTVETDAAGTPQENRPLDNFRTDDSTIYIKAFKANLRALPRTDADLVSKLEMGDKLTRTGYGNYWSAVTSPDGKTGYILTDLISFERIHKIAPPATPTPKATTTKSTTTKATTNKQTSTKQTTSKQTTTSQTTVPAETVQPTPAPEPAETIQPTPAPEKESQKEEHSDEFMLFARVIAMEGNGQYESYLAVASVIMNHVAHRNFPNTITGVLSRKNAFSVYKKAASGQPAKVNSTAMRAAYDAYYNGARNLPAYVIAFSTPAAYERSVASKGTFSKMAVYQRAYNAVWCYYPADKR